MTFQYKVRDPLGNEHEGSVDAASSEEATQKLRQDGFQVLSVEKGSDGAINLFPRRITKLEIINATSQLAIMVETGITLAAALDGICAQEENPTLKKLLLGLKSDVEAGEDFSSSLAKHPKYFDKTFVSLICASEQTGSLGEMLDSVANYLQKEVETRAKVRAALTYPVVMLVVALGVTIFLLTYVLPKFAPMFSRKGIKLPTITVIMMNLSDAMIHYWYFWLIGLVLSAVGFVFFARSEFGRRTIDLIKIRMPIAGAMFRKVAISRSVRTLGTMVESGVSMLDAIKLTAEVSGNYHYEQVWYKVLDDVTTGCQIHKSLAGSKLFPSTLVQMIASGEETGKLDFVLKRISNHYDQEVEMSLKSVTSMIEPIMITGMGVVVGGIAMSLLLPIFSLSRAH